MSRAAAILLLSAICIGFVFSTNSQLPKLPGDLLIEKPGIRLYIPLVSTLLLSIALTIFLNLIGF